MFNFSKKETIDQSSVKQNTETFQNQSENTKETILLRLEADLENIKAIESKVESGSSLEEGEVDFLFKYGGGKFGVKINLDGQEYQELKTQEYPEFSPLYESLYTLVDLVEGKRKTKSYTIEEEMGKVIKEIKNGGEVRWWPTDWRFTISNQEKGCVISVYHNASYGPRKKDLLDESNPKFKSPTMDATKSQLAYTKTILEIEIDFTNKDVLYSLDVGGMPE